MITMDADYLITKYDYAVPRYTSFPTAVQFKTDICLDTYIDTLKNLDTDKSVSLYVHIPFCHSLCHYCGCNTKIVSHYDPIAYYIESLLQEIDLIGTTINKNIRVDRVHFGGGSPNYAKVEDIKKIIDRMKDNFVFTDQTQIDMECDPRLLDEDKIGRYAAIGVSRMSLGIQDFNADVQEAMNRIQPFELVEKQMAFFRAAGLDDINFDLITGLPLQTLDTVKETLNHVTLLKPSRVAVFPYAHVPWMKKHQKLLEKYSRPDPTMRFEMTEYVREFLTNEGYESIGIDHYALPEDPLAIAKNNKTMRRNFQGYTDDHSDIIIGFGLSSISQFDDLYVQNTTDPIAYHKAIDDNVLPAVRYIALTDDDMKRRDLIATLMCYFEINLDDYKGIDIPSAALDDLKSDGLIDFNGLVLSITDKGKPFCRVVASCFDPYFNRSTVRHAKAV